jgi:hypothetical protein
MGGRLRAANSWLLTNVTIHLDLDREYAWHRGFCGEIPRQLVLEHDRAGLRKLVNASKHK